MSQARHAESCAKDYFIFSNQGEVVVDRLDRLPRAQYTALHRDPNYLGLLLVVLRVPTVLEEMRALWLDEVKLHSPTLFHSTVCVDRDGYLLTDPQDELRQSVNYVSTCAIRNED